MSNNDNNYESKDAKQWLAKNLKRYRSLKNLSQRQLAELAGLADSTVGELERGTKNPSLETLTLLANVLDIPVWYLLEEVDDFSNMDLESLRNLEVREKARIYSFLESLIEKIK